MTNVSKSSVAPIRHDNIDLEVTLATFPCHFGPIPCEIPWLASISGLPKTCGFSTISKYDRGQTDALDWQVPQPRQLCRPCEVSANVMPIFLLIALMVDKALSRLLARFGAVCYGHARPWLAVISAKSIGQRFVAPKV
jgi:hypothetical protein